MSALEFVPTGLFTTRRYDIARNGARVGEIEFTRRGGAAAFTIGGATYDAARDGVMSAAFHLQTNDQRVATAERTSAFRGGFTVSAGGKTYALKPATISGRAFAVTENGMQIGSIAGRGFFRRTCKAELPDEVAPEIKAFLAFLVIAMWQRQALTASVIGAATSGG